MYVSFAQNFEDIIIWRLFKGSQNPGFYLDVGAAHPVKDSVTHFFYKRGWRGLNVEPNVHYFKLLERQRPEDINLSCAVSDYEGEAEFNFIENDPKLSSLEKISDSFAQQHNLKIIKKTVPVTTLKNVIEKNQIRQIEFLKIDAEGAEQKILAGFPFETISPRVIIIEAVEAKSDVSTIHQWEPLLSRNAYSRAYFDGINCYYVKNTDSEALRILQVPLNAQDAFIKYEHTTLKFFIKSLKKRLLQ